MSYGAETKIGLKKAAAWGTPVACGAGDGLLITNEKINWSRESLKDDSAGQSFPGQIDQGLITSGGDLNAYLRYEDLLLLAMMLGSAAAPEVQGATAAYQHQLTWAASVNGLFATLALFRGYGVHEYPAAKVAKLTLAGQLGKEVTLNASLLCDTMNINTGAGVNNLTTIAAVNPAPTPRVLASAGLWRMNDQSGVALSGSDELKGKNGPVEFSLACDRLLKPDYLAGGGDKIAEPTSDGFPNITLTLKLGEYVSDTWLGELMAGTAKKADVTFTGPVCDGAFSYSFKLELPHLRLISTDGPNIDRGAKLPLSLTYEVLKPDAAPAGMTELTMPIRATIINKQTTSPLA